MRMRTARRRRVGGIGTVTCTIGTLPAGASATFMIVVSTAAAASPSAHWGIVSPRLRAEYNHAFQSGSTVSLQFADWLNGPTYAVGIARAKSDYFVLGVGTDFSFTNDDATVPGLIGPATVASVCQVRRLPPRVIRVARSEAD